VPVETGLSDGSMTALVGDPIPEGAHVITGQSGGSPTTARSGSPLLPFGGRRGGGAGSGGGRAVNTPPAASRGQGTGR